MATASKDALSDRDAYRGMSAAEDRPVPIKTLRRFIESVNIATELDEDTLTEIGARAKREYEVDKTSRSAWEDKMKDSMDLAMQVAGEKNYPWPKASNIKFPLVTTAAIQFAARAYPAIVNGRDVVKATVNGKDDGKPAVDAQGQPVMGPDGQPQWEVEPNAKRNRADRIAHHMSYQCLEEMDGWEEDTDKLLHIVPIIGCAFRKTWFDPGMGRNRSELVTAQKLVVNYWAKTLDTAPRVTQDFHLYPLEIKERVRAGLYLAHEYGPVAGSANDDDAPHEFLEQHRWLDLDKDNFPEPYIVTLHKETGKVCRIIARFDEEGIEVNNDGEVQRIVPVRYYTKFGFIPNPEGGFYDIGFGWLLHPLNEAINGTINQMLDAGHRQVTGGGFIGSGLRIKGGATRFRPGEYKQVHVTGSNVRENVVDLNFPGPSQTMFNLLGLLIEAARDITSVKDVMTGDEGPANEAAARTLARIEQGMKVFSAIYKRLFRSLKEEYRKLYRLNQIYLPQEQYFTLLDEPEAVSVKDYADGDLDISPAADPNMISDTQRMGRAEFMLQFLADPRVDGKEILKRVFTAANIEDPDTLVLEETPPDPTIAQAADEIEIKKRMADTEAQKVEIEADRMTAEAAKIRSEIILNLAKADEVSDKAEIESMKVLLDSILKRRQIDLTEKKIDTDARGDGGMGGQPGNGGGS